ncbi:STAS domain-containing protein [Blastococcus sp. TML/M2B]|nr:STAS domain-containing protein [Blastococcus sp. TML/M2B]MBN1091209.1 STAS domain-containing protein [Blastococcus sp. TML/M2B]
MHLDDTLFTDGLADVRWLLHDALLAGARRLVVDLSGVQHLSSTAVASFLWAHRICRARGGTVVLRGANRRTLDLLRRTGLWRVLRLETGRGQEVA